MQKTIMYILFSIAGFYVSAQLEPQVAPINPDYLEYLQHPERFRGYIPPIKNIHSLPKNFVSTKALPASYDLRTQGLVTSVKNQGSCGACWTFATCASIESFWLKQGLGAYNLSEDNINNCHGFDYPPCEGGNLYISFAYLARGSGIMLENDDPYQTTPNPCPTGINPIRYITQGRYIPADINAIKQAIYDYGALYTVYYHDDAYYNSTNKTYYYNGTEYANHAVTLVGWDDNKVTAGGTGAWICKNSWGTSWGENGYFYISYNDTRVNSEVGFFPAYYNYQWGDYIYTYAPFGNINDVGFGSNTAYALIKFTANGNITAKEVGSYVASGNSYISFEIYDNFDGTTLSGLLDSIGEKYCDYAGFRYFPLHQPLAFSNNDDIYVKVKYVTLGYNYPIPVEQVYSGYASNVTLETGVQWVSSNGITWQPCGNGTSRQYDLTISLLVSTAGPVHTQWSSNKTTTCDGWVQFYDQSTNNPTNWFWDFGDGTTSNQQHPLHYYASNGIYTVKLKSWNIFGSDSLIRSNYITVNMPSSPSTTNDTVCKGEQATLVASGSNVYWYSSPLGTPIAQGNVFTTPPLSQTMTYYVSVKNLSSSPLVGGDSRINTDGTFLNSSKAHYLVFNIYEPCILYSVKVNAQSAGSRNITLLDAQNNVIKDTTLYLVAGIQTIVLNYPLSPGQRYKLRANAYCQLFRNDANCTYPYNIGGLISIDSSSATTSPQGYYYFFYDWNVYSYCESPRTPVQAVVHDVNVHIHPSGNVALCENENLLIQLSGNPTSILWYPSNETTPSIEVSQAGTYYAYVSDGPCQYNTDTLNVTINPNPIPGFNYTIQGLTAHFISTAQHFTGIRYVFGDGTYIETLNPYHTFPSPGTWEVIQYVWNSCDTTSLTDTIFIQPTANHEFAFPGSIYPNPSSDYITIYATQPILTHLTIYNLQGVKVKEVSFDKPISRVDISILDLPDGNYLLFINQTYKTLITKLR